MHTDLGNWFLAALPIIGFMIVMLGFRWGGSRAAAFSWLVTIVVARLFFGADLNFFGYTHVKGFLLALDVLLIIWAAMFFYIMTEMAGTIQYVGSWISSLSTNRAIQGIFMGWLFPSFLQGMGGFGVPVAVSAPLLVSAGFSPVKALIMASVGHSWAITFGSMASSFQVLIAASNLPGEILAPATSFLLGITVLICGILVTYIADGYHGIRSTFPLTLLLAVIMGGGQYLFSVNGLWIISVTLPALVALIVGYLLIMITRNNKTIRPKNEKKDPMLIISLLPYGVLVITTLLVNLITPINNALKGVSFTLIFPDIVTTLGDIYPSGPGRAIQLFNHPGEIILISALISYFIFIQYGLLIKTDLSRIIKLSANKSIDTTLTLLIMVGVATIMSHTRMINILANGISKAFGPDLFPVASPFIGGLGAFITGNNSNSNLIFSSLQMRSSELLNLSVPLILASQTSGGAIGSMMAPTKIILGCATVGLSDQEGMVISKILIYGIIMILIIGMLTLLISRSGFINAVAN